MSNPEDRFDAYRAEIESAERRVAREIDPGPRALVVAILVFVLLLTFLLPHTGHARGIDVLTNSQAAVDAGITLPLRVFCWVTLALAVGFSMLALLTRRWAVAWMALAGSWLASAMGLLAVWSRQTAPVGYPRPGVGLVIAWIAVVLLAFHWARVVWTRTAAQLAAEDHRRRLAADQQSKGLLETLDPPAADDEPKPETD